MFIVCLFCVFILSFVCENISSDNYISFFLFFNVHYQRSRYLQCSNYQLVFDPATGDAVNNGVITVTLNYNITGRKWYWVAERALQAINLMEGIDYADYGAFVLPDSIDFEGSDAYGYSPGVFTIYKSSVASIPMVQVHEFGTFMICAMIVFIISVSIFVIMDSSTVYSNIYI